MSPPPETRLSVRGEIWPGSCPFISPKSRSNLLSQPAQNLAGIARGAGRGEGPVCLKAFNAIKTSGLGAIGTARGRGSPAGWAGGPWGHPLRPHPRLWGRERGCRPAPSPERWGWSGTTATPGEKSPPHFPGLGAPPCLRVGPQPQIRPGLRCSQPFPSFPPSPSLPSVSRGCGI